MAEQEESLVMRRSRRSTAGNRMEAALAEFKAEELGQDAEEDVDFVMEVDEQDAFGSDFESTDEEGAQEDVDATAEKMVREQDAPSRKQAGRTQLEKVTAAAHARQKATFHPDLTTEDSPKPQAAKIKRRVSMGVAVDAETGAVLERGKRHSMRSHTLLNTSMSDLRAKDELEKKSTLPRRAKTKIRAPTQDELIARALDMEEGNIKEHKNYLELEEEKRKRARVIRTAVHGPLIRYISKAEQVTVEMKVEPQTPSVPSVPPPPPPVHQPGSFFFPSSAYSPTSAIPPSYTSQQPHPRQPGPSQFVIPQAQAGPSSHVTFIHYQQGQHSPPPPVLMLAPPPPPPKPDSILVKQTATRNYLVHEMGQEDGPRPLWKETMEAVFGDHANWEDMKAYHPKNRPTARILDKCPITGRTAIYRDPRSGVPFASADAYRVLSDVLAHKFLWSESLGCYVSPPDGTDSTTTSGLGASTSRTPKSAVWSGQRPCGAAIWQLLDIPLHSGFPSVPNGNCLPYPRKDHDAS